MDVLGLTEQMAGFVIRPSRAQYDISDLGEKAFEFEGIHYQRTDFFVPKGYFSNDHERLEGSIYMEKFHKKENPRPLLLYLHGNSSSRITAKNYLKNLIPYFDVASFDFRGCGKSEGKYLTLGYLEREDVRVVIKYIDEHFGERKYLIWGRSMGAVTNILFTAKYGQNPEKYLAIVLDSPFGDLEKIIHFVANKRYPMLPTFMVNSAIGNISDYVKQQILEEYGKEFLIKKHKPYRQIANIKIPIFFIGSKSDDLVDVEQLKSLYTRATCYKELEILDGGHNESRPEHLKVAITEFLVASVNRKREKPIRKKIFDFPLINERQQSPEKEKSNGERNKKLFKNLSLNQSLAEEPEVIENENLNKSSILDGAGEFFNEKMGNILSFFDSAEPENQKVKETHNEILNKVIPKNSERRVNRIWSRSGNENKEENKIEKLF